MADSLKKQAIFLLFGRMIAMVVAAVSPMILVRMLAVDQFGVFRQIVFVEGVVVSLVMMSISENRHITLEPVNKTRQDHGVNRSRQSWCGIMVEMAQDFQTQPAIKYLQQ